MVAAWDLRSNLGSNLALVRELTGLDPWVAPRSQLSAALEAADRRKIPESDSWRPPFLQKLLTERLEAYYTGEEDEEKRLQGLIQSLVTN